MAASIVGGELIQHTSPAGALHAAAAILAVPPLLLIWATWSLVDETRSTINLPELKQTFRGLAAAFSSRKLWIVAFFLFLYYFSPGFGTPLYYHMTDTLHFSQGYIGMLGAIDSAGSIAGALLYRRYLSAMTSKRLLKLSILFGTISSRYSSDFGSRARSF